MEAMKKDLGVIPAVYPMPVLMVAAYDENGVRNPRLKGIHPHSLRVGAAGSLYQKTKNRKAVQYALGHRNPEMTEKYIKNLEVFDELKDAF